MGDEVVLMMANHGVVAIGDTVAQAYRRLYFLERSCRTQLFSMWTGQRRRIVPDAVLDKMRAEAGWKDPTMAMSGSDYYFAAMKRMLDRTQPDYAE